MHKCLSGTGSSIQTSSSSETVGKCSSVSSSSSSAILGRQQANMSSLGEWSSILGSEWGFLIFFICQVAAHCMLREKGDGHALGVAGLKDKLNFLVMKHEVDHGSRCRGVGTLKPFTPTFISCYLLRCKLPSKRHHLRWSWSDQIIFLLLHESQVLGRITAKEGCVDPFNGIIECQRSEIILSKSCSAVNAALHMEYSQASGQ